MPRSHGKVAWRHACPEDVRSRSADSGDSVDYGISCLSSVFTHLATARAFHLSEDDRVLT